MSIFNWNRKKNIEKRSEGITYINPNSLNGNTISFWMNNLQYNPLNLSVVYRCVELISDGCAMLPIEVTKNGKTLHNNISMLFDNHFTLIKCIMQQILLNGNGYAYIERAADGKPINLRFLQNKDVQIQYQEERNELWYTCSKITHKRIDPKDMLHFKKNSIDGVHGLSVLAYANKAVGLAVSTDTTANSYFSNGGNLSGILCAKSHTTYDERKDAKDAFVGNLKSGDISVLPSEFEYQSVQMNSADAQLLESRQYSVVDIARFFGVSPVLLGDLSHGGINSVEQLQTQYLVQTLQPYIIMIEDELNKKLATSNQKISLDENYLIRSDKASEANYYTTLVSNGILSANEARVAIGYEAKEGLDDIIIAYTKIEDNKLNNEDNGEENNKETEQESNGN